MMACLLRHVCRDATERSSEQKASDDVAIRYGLAVLGLNRCDYDPRCQESCGYESRPHRSSSPPIRLCVFGGAVLLISAGHACAGDEPDDLLCLLKLRF